jgi:hypothetical protein
VKARENSRTPPMFMTPAAMNPFLTRFFLI